MPTLDWVYQSVTQWVTIKGSLFQGEVLSWVHSFGVVMLVVFGLDWALQAVTGGPSFIGLRTIGRFVFTYLTVLFLITYYNSPLPWGVGSSVHSLFPDFGRQITKMIADQALNDVFKALDDHLARVKPPDSLLSLDVVPYLLLWGLTWVAEGVLFLLSNVGIVMLGIGTVLGILSIPWLLLPGNTLFWDWLEYMVSWSMFQAVGAAMVWVWSHAFIGFFTQVGTGSIIQDLSLVKEFLILNVSFWWTAKRTYTITQSLYGRAVGHATGYAEHISSFV